MDLNKRNLISIQVSITQIVQNCEEQIPTMLHISLRYFANLLEILEKLEFGDLELDYSHLHAKINRKVDEIIKEFNSSAESFRRQRKIKKRKGKFIY